MARDLNIAFESPRKRKFPVQKLLQPRHTLKSQIDADAEAETLKYITPGTGQAMTYQRKIEEARRLTAGIGSGEPIPADYPMLSATVGIDGETVVEVAQIVLQMDAQWALIGAAIENVRMTAKEAIDLAAEEEEATAVTPAWPAW